MSDFYGSSDEKENINVLNKSIDLGSYFWDTAVSIFMKYLYIRILSIHFVNLRFLGYVWMWCQ